MLLWTVFLPLLALAEKHTQVDVALPFEGARASFATTDEGCERVAVRSTDYFDIHRWVVQAVGSLDAGVNAPSGPGRLHFAADGDDLALLADSTTNRTYGQSSSAGCNYYRTFAMPESGQMTHFSSTKGRLTAAFILLTGTPLNASNNDINTPSAATFRVYIGGTYSETELGLLGDVAVSQDLVAVTFKPAERSSHWLYVYSTCHLTPPLRLELGVDSLHRVSIAEDGTIVVTRYGGYAGDVAVRFFTQTLGGLAEGTAWTVTALDSANRFVLRAVYYPALQIAAVLWADATAVDGDAVADGTYYATQFVIDAGLPSKTEETAVGTHKKSIAGFDYSALTVAISNRQSKPSVLIVYANSVSGEGLLAYVPVESQPFTLRATPM